MALKNTAVTIEKDVTWYYEEPRYIEIIHWITERDGRRVAKHIKIGWAKLRDSVQRKYGASQQSVQRTATPSRKSKARGTTRRR